MANKSNNQSRSQGGSRQPTMNGLMDTAREHPVATAAAVGGAVAAGAFLWSKRDRIGEQMSQMSGQISEWSENMRSGQSGSRQSSDRRSQSSPAGGRTASSAELGMAGSPTSSTGATGGRKAAAQPGHRETGQNLNPSRTATPTAGV